MTSRYRGEDEASLMRMLNKLTHQYQLVPSGAASTPVGVLGDKGVGVHATATQMRRMLLDEAENPLQQRASGRNGRTTVEKLLRVRRMPEEIALPRQEVDSFVFEYKKQQRLRQTTIRIQTWWRQVRCRKHYLAFVAVRVKTQQQARQSYFRGWVYYVRCEKQARILVQRRALHALRCAVEQAQLDSIGGMLGNSEYLVRFRRNVIRQRLLRLFMHWRRWSKSARRRRRDLGLAMAQVRQQINQRRVLVVFHMWRRYTSYRFTQRNFLQLPEFEPPLPYWDYFLYVEATLSRLNTLAFQWDRGKSTRNAFRRWRAYVLMQRHKKQQERFAREQYRTHRLRATMRLWKRAQAARAKEHEILALCFASLRTWVRLMRRHQASADHLYAKQMRKRVRDHLHTWRRFIEYARRIKVAGWMRALEHQSVLETAVHAWRNDTPAFLRAACFRAWRRYARNRLRFERFIYQYEQARLHQVMRKCFNALRPKQKRSKQRYRIALAADDWMEAVVVGARAVEGTERDWRLPTAQRLALQRARRQQHIQLFLSHANDRLIWTAVWRALGLGRRLASFQVRVRGWNSGWHELPSERLVLGLQSAVRFLEARGVLRDHTWTAAQFRVIDDRAKLAARRRDITQRDQVLLACYTAHAAAERLAELIPAFTVESDYSQLRAIADAKHAMRTARRKQRAAAKDKAATSDKAAERTARHHRWIRRPLSPPSPLISQQASRVSLASRARLVRADAEHRNSSQASVSEHFRDTAARIKAEVMADLGIQDTRADRSSCGSDEDADADSRIAVHTAPAGFAVSAPEAEAAAAEDVDVAGAVVEDDGDTGDGITTSAAAAAAASAGSDTSKADGDGDGSDCHGAEDTSNSSVDCDSEDAGETQFVADLSNINAADDVATQALGSTVAIPNVVAPLPVSVDRVVLPSQATPGSTPRTALRVSTPRQQQQRQRSARRVAFDQDRGEERDSRGSSSDCSDGDSDGDDIAALHEWEPSEDVVLRLNDEYFLQPRDDRFAELDMVYQESIELLYSSDDDAVGMEARVLAEPPWRRQTGADSHSSLNFVRYLRQIRNDASSDTGSSCDVSSDESMSESSSSDDDDEDAVNLTLGELTDLGLSLSEARALLYGDAGNNQTAVDAVRKVTARAASQRSGAASRASSTTALQRRGKAAEAEARRQAAIEKAAQRAAGKMAKAMAKRERAEAKAAEKQLMAEMKQERQEQRRLAKLAAAEEKERKRQEKEQRKRERAEQRRLAKRASRKQLGGAGKRQRASSSGLGGVAAALRHRSSDDDDDDCGSAGGEYDDDEAAGTTGGKHRRRRGRPAAKHDDAGAPHGKGKRRRRKKTKTKKSHDEAPGSAHGHAKRARRGLEGSLRHDDSSDVGDDNMLERLVQQGRNAASASRQSRLVDGGKQAADIVSSSSYEYEYDDYDSESAGSSVVDAGRRRAATMPGSTRPATSAARGRSHSDAPPQKPRFVPTKTELVQQVQQERQTAMQVEAQRQEHLRKQAALLDQAAGDGVALGSDAAAAGRSRAASLPASSMVSAATGVRPRAATVSAATASVAGRAAAGSGGDATETMVVLNPPPNDTFSLRARAAGVSVAASGVLTVPRGRQAGGAHTKAAGAGADAAGRAGGGVTATSRPPTLTRAQREHINHIYEGCLRAIRNLGVLPAASILRPDAARTAERVAAVARSNTLHRRVQFRRDSDSDSDSDHRTRRAAAASSSSESDYADAEETLRSVMAQVAQEEALSPRAPAPSHASSAATTPKHGPRLRASATAGNGARDNNSDSDSDEWSDWSDIDAAQQRSAAMSRRPKRSQALRLRDYHAKSTRRTAPQTLRTDDAEAKDAKRFMKQLRALQRHHSSRGSLALHRGGSGSSSALLRVQARAPMRGSSPALAAAHSTQPSMLGLGVHPGIRRRRTVRQRVVVVRFRRPAYIRSRRATVVRRRRRYRARILMRGSASTLVLRAERQRRMPHPQLARVPSVWRALSHARHTPASSQPLMHSRLPELLQSRAVLPRLRSAGELRRRRSRRRSGIGGGDGQGFKSGGRGSAVTAAPPPSPHYPPLASVLQLGTAALQHRQVFATPPQGMLSARQQCTAVPPLRLPQLQYRSLAMMKQDRQLRAASMPRNPARIPALDPATLRPVVVATSPPTDSARRMTAAPAVLPPLRPRSAAPAAAKPLPLPTIVLDPSEPQAERKMPAGDGAAAVAAAANAAYQMRQRMPRHSPAPMWRHTQPEQPDGIVLQTQRAEQQGGE